MQIIILNLLSFLASSISFTAGIIQTKKLLKTKSSKGISLTMYIMAVTSTLILIGLSFYPFNLYSLVFALTSLSTQSFNTFLTWKFRNN